MSNLLSNAERVLRDLQAACSLNQRPDWLAQAHFLAAYNLVGVLERNYTDLVPSPWSNASASAATYRWNRAALVHYTRNFDEHIRASLCYLLPEAEDRRGFLPVSQARCVLIVAERLRTDFHAVSHANLTPSGHDNVAAKLIRRVQRFIIGGAVLAAHFYRSWVIILENEAAYLSHLPLPHSSFPGTIRDAHPISLEPVLRTATVHREVLLADLASYLNPAPNPIAGTPLAGLDAHDNPAPAPETAAAEILTDAGAIRSPALGTVADGQPVDADEALSESQLAAATNGMVTSTASAASTQSALP
ncbi:hypothetical protein CcaverHIS002_0507360 [Cutaneotrichosporon cavernicola]|nr:hypothetical protein CcaverHIS002_0507360 [Cutaneotrichosporon cavernicola]BEJ00940.1 hypothetical protein CcaverHIS631_0507970 [Cutaneotrichosporon cavernicola]BEJ08705.1 hypothetical protein CcaverHIS641_0507990 [Cutaneotrichosporon cavernicola]